MRSVSQLFIPNPYRPILSSLTLHLALLTFLVAGPLDGQNPSGRATGQSDSVKTLTADQRAATEALFTAMRDEAVLVGGEVLAAEQALDAAFAAGVPEAELRRLVERVTERRGELRWVHLRTPLRMRELLTPHQLHLYDRLRGYGDEAGHDHGHHGG